MRTLRTLFPALGLVLIPTGLVAQTQTRAEVIRGLVTTDSGVVIVDANVIATMAPNREIFRTSTDSAGRYRLVIANGTGDYLLYIAAPGRAAFRRRLRRTGNDSVFVVDAQLASAVPMLAASRTIAKRTRPPRTPLDPTIDVGGLSAVTGETPAAISPDQEGDLLSGALTMPGVALTPDGGISVFGVDPSQNRVTLGGSTFDGASLPREAPVLRRVVSSVYDPTYGGFGGALISAQLLPGQIFTSASGHLSLDAPQLQWTDPAARTNGQRFTRGQLSYWRRGELIQDRWVYSAGIQGSAHVAPSPSLIDADPTALLRMGVSPDSAARLMSILNAAGVPTGDGVVSGNLHSTGVNLAFRADRARALTSFGLANDPTPRVSIVGVFDHRRSDPIGTTLLAAPSSAGRRRYTSGFLQGTYSRYFGADTSYLTETRSALSFTSDGADPLFTFPRGRVQVTSELPSDIGGIAALGFGGNGARSSTRNWRWQTTSELTFSLARAPRHRLKLVGETELQGFMRHAIANELGTFSFQSLGDLAANAPGSFTRTLSVPTLNSGAVSASFAVADYWTHSPDLQFVLGPRLEWSTLTRAPARNSEVVRLFGVPNDLVPGGFHVSPRFGFTWIYRGVKRAGGPRGFGGTSALGSVFVPPQGVLRGGIGEFRAPVTATLLAGPIAATGLPQSATVELRCVGSAVPTPDWPGYAADPGAVPTSCLDGSGSSLFSESAPRVELLDPSYALPRRWTASLTWGSAYRWLHYTIDASYSLLRDQPGRLDLNLSRSPTFSIDTENGRPVYVEPSAIVPSTGLISLADARPQPAFGPVIARESDGRSVVRQVTLSLQPFFPRSLGSFIVGGSYTLTDGRALARGFDAGVFDDPFRAEWSRSAFTARHQLRFNLGYRVRPLGMLFMTYWGVQSGWPFTPVVGGDVNGDGFVNDRAFVFDPVAAPSADVADGLVRLLRDGSRETRDCLREQLDRVAGINSCHGGWRFTGAARLEFTHRFGPRSENFHVGLYLSNPLSAIDRMLHGSDQHGWGTPPVVDPRLYLVRGFDASSRRFVYEVNPRFGSQPGRAAALSAPARLTIDISFNVTPSYQKQQVEYYLRPTRSQPDRRPPADTILLRMQSSGMSPSSWLRWVLANQDSLLLSAEQVRDLTRVTEDLAETRRRLWRTLAEDLAALPEEFDAEAAMQRITDTNRAVFATTAETDAIVRILTPIQIRLLPESLQRDLSRPRR